MNVLMPDGTTITGVPEGTTQSELLARYGKYTQNQQSRLTPPTSSPEEQLISPVEAPSAGIASIKPQATNAMDDITENTIRILGVVSFNQKQIQYLQTKMPNIQKILTNPLQHYVNDTFKLVTDINGLI